MRPHHGHDVESVANTLPQSGQDVGLSGASAYRSDQAFVPRSASSVKASSEASVLASCPPVMAKGSCGSSSRVRDVQWSPGAVRR